MVLRIGLIGAGGMGSFHARTLAELPGVAITVVADAVPAAAARLAGELRAEASTDSASVAGSTELDGVVIASPDDTHAALALTALEAGLPVLCEKPLATSVADGRRVVEHEVQAGRRLLQLGFMREYDFAHMQVREQLAELGPIHHVRCVHMNANGFERSTELLVGQSIVHDLHTIRFLTGRDITAVTASATRRPSGAIRHLLVVVWLDDHAHATIEFDDAGYAYEVHVEVVAEHGSAMTGRPVGPEVRRAGTIRRPVGTDWFSRFAGAYRIQDASWIDSVRSGQATGPTAWDGLVALVAVEAIVKSLASGGPVSVPVLERPVLYDP